jgi:hypothetical protein
VTDDVVRIDAIQEAERAIAQAFAPVDAWGHLVGDEILCRFQGQPGQSSTE